MIEELSGSDFKPVEFELNIGGSGEGIASYTITTQEGFRIRVGERLTKLTGMKKMAAFLSVWWTIKPETACLIIQMC